MKTRDAGESDQSYAARILADMAERWDMDRNACLWLIRHLRHIMKG